MNVQAEVPMTDPLRSTWEAYRLTDAYANTRRWAFIPTSVDGSLWAAYVEGWKARAALSDAAPEVAGVDGMARAAAYVQKKADDYATENCSSEWDTGALVYHYGTPGMEYHHTLIEIADELATLATPTEGAAPEGCVHLFTRDKPHTCADCGYDDTPAAPASGDGAWRADAERMLRDLREVGPPNVILQQLALLGRARDILTAALASPTGVDDRARMDWLETMHVQVRVPLVHGSRALFHASPPDEDDPDEPSDLRERVDAALAAQDGGAGHG